MQTSQVTSSKKDQLHPELVFFAVRELPPKYRQIVYLHYYEEYSIRDIAEMMKLSETAVKTRLLRARQKLKSAMEACDAERG